ncbi:histidine kinase [Sulfitobacter alexandrii]|uniref:histidine kinase n=1 Tax=Sulfitobacter alexandrii TaxID=1917485 RepID=A0A1J0WEA5_9RHOB|nr:PAS domain-containing protein [Sulfitobacter alexandrii]APE42649.1 histidine kinase [Sulfitobacter alexandrii]
MSEEKKRQVHRAFDDSPQRFREKHADDQFSGASGVLFEQAMAQTRMAICLSDPNAEDSPIVFANRAFMELTGYDEAEIVGRNCRFLQGPETDPAAVRRIRTALEKEAVIVVELVNYRKDGEKFWNALHLGPIYNENNELLYYFGSQWDVSDVHAARAEEANAKAMSRELSHRMKNMFSVIASIVSVTGRMEGNTSIAEAINQRIRALGRAYEPTLDDARLGSIEVGQAIRSVLAPYDPEEDRIELDGNGLRAEANVVSILGLALHELATNAMKYGALATDHGKVKVAWRLDKDTSIAESRRVSLEWTETGTVPKELREKSGGTGHNIMETLLRSADGVIDYDWRPEGLHVHISLPLID